MNADDDVHDSRTPPRYPELHSMNLEADGLRQTCEADLLFLERYEGWTEIGRGAHGTVIRTYCRPTDMDVALKLLVRGEREMDERRLQAETHALARVSHPCVVRTFAAFARGALAWIEMELIEGCSLAHEIARRQTSGEAWPAGDQLAVAWAAAEGLAAIHAAGIVHRDVKPDNILLPASRKPAAKLVDFGVARVLNAAVLSGVRYSPGTPRYSAPELVTLGRTGPEADVYAFGVTLYELFSGGTHPYALPRGSSVVESINAHVRLAPVPLPALAADLDDDVVDVIARALDKRPELRPSAREIADVLRGALPATHAERLDVASWSSATRRRSPGTRVAVRVAAAGVSMLMLMGVIAAWRQWRGGSNATQVARTLENVPAPLAPRVAAPAARLHVTWAAPGVVGVENQGSLDLDHVTVSVAGVAYRLGPVAVDEEAWVFAEGPGSVTVEGVASDGTRVVAVLS